MRLSWDIVIINPSPLILIGGQTVSRVYTAILNNDVIVIVIVTVTVKKYNKWDFSTFKYYLCKRNDFRRTHRTLLTSFLIYRSDD